MSDMKESVICSRWFLARCVGFLSRFGIMPSNCGSFFQGPVGNVPASVSYFCQPGHHVNNTMLISDIQLFQGKAELVRKTRNRFAKMPNAFSTVRRAQENL